MKRLVCWLIGHRFWIPRIGGQQITRNCDRCGHKPKGGKA